jgi:hypothetical protein
VADDNKVTVTVHSEMTQLVLEFTTVMALMILISTAKPFGITSQI